VLFGDVDGYPSFQSLLDPAHPAFVAPEIDPKTAVAALMSSSGTTGFPKPVQLTHFNLIANCLQQK